MTNKQRLDLLTEVMRLDSYLAGYFNTDDPVEATLLKQLQRNTSSMTAIIHRA